MSVWSWHSLVPLASPLQLFSQGYEARLGIVFSLCSVVAEEYHSNQQLYRTKAKQHTQTHAKKVSFADMVKVRVAARLPMQVSALLLHF